MSHGSHARQRPRLGAVRVILIAFVALVNVAIFAAVGWAVTNQQRVVDQLVVWDYQPSAAIATYAERSTMSTEAEFLFYASRPVIAPNEDFDEVCSSRQEDVGVLGCYLPPSRTIFLFDVTDERLDGLEEVIAAHEMLHAAWARMSDDERDELGPLLEAEVTKRADDTALADTLEFYAKAEPGERLNELHSIVATEFADLGPELERHFALFFSDRAALVALHEQSNAVFQEQAKSIDDLVARIDALTASIDTDYAAYNAGYDQLNADIASFNARADSGDFDSQADFTNERNALLQRQADLDASFASIQARETEYYGLVDQLEALNAEVDELNEAINIEPRDAEGT